MAKTLNIYLTAKDKKQLLDIKYKYHISLSTIAEIITAAYETKIQGLAESWLYEEKGNKTSIKPRLRYNTDNAKLYTNAIKIFINKDLAKYTDKKTAEKINGIIYNKFQTTYEENWDGNRFQRIMPRILKQNPKYYKKLLGVE